MALLDVATVEVRIAGQVVDVQFDCGGAGILHRAGVSGPVARRAAVDAADHGDPDRRGRPLEQAQVVARSVILVGDVRKIRQRLGEAIRARCGQARVALGLLAHLFLEQRIQHHRADPRVGQLPDTVDGLRQRRRRRH